MDAVAPWGSVRSPPVAGVRQWWRNCNSGRPPIRRAAEVPSIKPCLLCAATLGLEDGWPPTWMPASSAPTMVVRCPLSSAYRLLVDWRSHSESPGLQARFCLTPPAPSSTRRAARPSDKCPRLPLFSPALPRQTRGVRFANHARRGRVSHARGPIEDGEVIRVRAAAKGRDGLPTSAGSRVASTELLRGMAHPGCAVVVAASLRLVERFPKGFPPRGSRGGSREGLRPRTLSRGIAIARRARAVRFPRVSRPLLPLAPGKHCFRHLRGRNRDACTSDRAAARITITA